VGSGPRVNDPASLILFWNKFVIAGFVAVRWLADIFVSWLLIQILIAVRSAFLLIFVLLDVIIGRQV
jgi:hypothetical protein